MAEVHPQENNPKISHSGTSVRLPWSFPLGVLSTCVDDVICLYVYFFLLHTSWTQSFDSESMATVDHFYMERQIPPLAYLKQLKNF